MFFFFPLPVQSALIQLDTQIEASSTAPAYFRLVVDHSPIYLQDTTIHAEMFTITPEYWAQGSYTYPDRHNQCDTTAGGTGFTANPTFTSDWYSTTTQFTTDNTAGDYADCSQPGIYYAVWTTLNPGADLYDCTNKDCFYSAYQFDGFSVTALESTCENCTYVRSFMPVDNSYVYSTTSISTGATYKVRSADVVDQDNVYIRGVWKSIKHDYTPYEQQLYQGGFDDQVLSYDSDEIFSALFDSAATGTITLNYDIYERIYNDSSWWEFWEWGDESWTERVLARDVVTFYLYDITEAAEIASIKANFFAEQQAIIESSQTECTINGQISVACLTYRIQQGIDAFLHAPPHGYAYYIYETLTSTSTATTTLAISMTMPTSSPASGYSINLDVSGTIENSIDSLNNQYDVKGHYDRAMELWDFFWYSVLIFWILSRVVKTFDFNFNYDVNERSQPSSSRGTSHINDVNMRSTRRGDIDMRRK